MANDNEPVTPDVPRYYGPLIALVLIVLLGIIVFVTVKIATGVKNTGQALQEDWKYISDIRAADAAAVEAELDAGMDYAGKLILRLAAEPSDVPNKPSAVRVFGAVNNSGARDVVVANVEVTFLSSDSSLSPETHTAVLFNASANSVRADKPLNAGAVREVDFVIDNVRSGWQDGSVEYKLSGVRVYVGPE